MMSAVKDSDDGLDAPARGARRPRLGRLTRVLAPSIATLMLICALVFTILFTATDWAWIAFLSGILFAAVLSLVSASWKSAWRIARRTAQAAHFKELYTAERAQHAQARQQLDQALGRLEAMEMRAVRSEAALQRQRASTGTGEASGVAGAAAAARTPDAARAAAEAHLSSPAAYADSIAEELTGWDDPEARVRRAIESDGFDLYLQDIIALGEAQAPARLQEVLIRMRDEEENMLPPGAFLPIVERCGLMPVLDRHVVKKALGLRPSGAPGWAEGDVLCINLARDTLRDTAFAADIESLLRAAGVPPERLCFELEDADVQAALVDAARLARELKAIGCRRSLDGFGGSRVAFDHLQRVAVDFVKIDGRIVYEIGRDPLAIAKVNAIQRLCRTIGVRTIAEQVESEATLVALRTAGVDYAQGFGIARPVPFAAA